MVVVVFMHHVHGMEHELTREDRRLAVMKRSMRKQNLKSSCEYNLPNKMDLLLIRLYPRLESHFMRSRLAKQWIQQQSNGGSVESETGYRK